MLRIASTLLRNSGLQAHDQRELALAFVDLGDLLAADRGLDDRIHVAPRRQAVARDWARLTVITRLGWPS